MANGALYELFFSCSLTDHCQEVIFGSWGTPKWLLPVMRGGRFRAVKTQTMHRLSAATKKVAVAVGGN